MACSSKAIGQASSQGIDNGSSPLHASISYVKKQMKLNKKIIRRDMNFKIGEEIRVRLWKDITREFIIKGRTVYNAPPVKFNEDSLAEYIMKDFETKIGTTPITKISSYIETIETPIGLIDNSQIIKNNCCGEFATVVSVDENEIKILFDKEEINKIVEENQIKFNKYILIKKNQLKKIKEMKKKDKEEKKKLEW